jgi:O-antigen ligase
MITGEVDHMNRNILVLTIGNVEWVFLVTEFGMYHLNLIGNIAPLVVAEAAGFSNNPMFGSGRGYIWSRTFPLIRETLLVGHGADTYAIFFPQNDRVARHNAGFPLDRLIDKPHNMYLHMAVGTGLLSMIAFLAMLGLYFVQSVKLYWRREYEEFTEFVGVGIFLGVTGFAFAALVNDSSVSVMPMFYGLLGTGIAINIMLKRAFAYE